MIALGIDVGTQGVRVLAVQPDGRVVARARAVFARPARAMAEAGWHEQDPRAWWSGVRACLSRVTSDLGERRREIQAVAFSATSGTICLLDHAGQPLSAAIMYDDIRARDAVPEVARAGAALAESLGYRFNSSFGLPKLVWLARHRPQLVAAARYLAHAGDFLAGQLTGNFNVTDETQALKSGYDLWQRRWPPFIQHELGIPLAKLPRVVRSGTVIGSVTPSAAAETGLSASTPVLAGATDGCAGQLAAGSAAPGEWVSVLGTTLVLKGVAVEPVLDAQGRLYNHRHPDGYWLPGGASNSGGGALERRFPGASFAAWDAQAAGLMPTGLLVYPESARGERFPFVHAEANGFLLGNWSSEVELYAGYLEGIAYIERVAYDLLDTLGVPAGERIATCGGAASSAIWLQLRADILGRELTVAEHPEPAFGAAILALAGSTGSSVADTTRAMVRMRQRVTPDRARSRQYADLYARFVVACRQRGWLD